MDNKTALTKIDKAQKHGALVFFDRENGFPQVDLYRLEITEMTINKENDCHGISSGKKKQYMPKKEVVDRIGEASGIVFVFGKTTTQTLEDASCGKRTVYTGLAQGKIRMSDGTWRTSSLCDYGFDPTLRAMLDYDVTELTAQTRNKRKSYEGKEYGATLARAILEYQKVAVQRANTGARLRVIRELRGMPIAFSEEELSKPLYFGRIVQNTSYILQTPEGRTMATAQALGMDISTLFGGKKLPDPTQGRQEAAPNDYPPADEPPGDPPDNNNTADLAEEVDFPDEPAGEGTPAGESEFQRLTNSLRKFLEGYKTELDVVTKTGRNPYKLAEEELANPSATEETRSVMIERLRSYLKAKGINV
jgi:hypothetical protein